MDDKLKLLAGLPIFVEGIGNIYPLTLKTIAQIGENIYNTFLSYLIFEKEDLKEKELYEDNIDCFDIITRNAILDINYRQVVLSSLSLFFAEEVKFHFDDNYKFFYIGNFEDGRFIQKSNFEKIKEIIKYQNCAKDLNNDEEQFNPSSEKARQLIEKMKKNRQKLKKLKQNEEGDPLTLYDLVSILSANGNGINIVNVWDLTMVQFNDQFNRMKMLEDYDINIRSLLAGAKSDDINMKHWMRKIKSDE